LQEIIISKPLLNRIGNEIIERITANTQAGKDIDGKPFNKYSTKPLYIPAGAFYAPGWKTTGKRMIKSKDAEYRRKIGGKYWVIIPGGYAKLKSTRFPQDGGNVNLHVTGNMLNSLAVIERGNDYVTIGFNNKEAATKAMYHQIMGAGKSKVIRKFLGLPNNELAVVMGSFTKLIAAEVEKMIVIPKS